AAAVRTCAAQSAGGAAGSILDFHTLVHSGRGQPEPDGTRGDGAAAFLGRAAQRPRKCAGHWATAVADRAGRSSVHCSPLCPCSPRPEGGDRMKRALIFAGLALAGAASATAQWGGSLRYCIRTDPKTLHPLDADDEASEMVRYLTGGVLIRINRL